MGWRNRFGVLAGLLLSLWTGGVSAQAARPADLQAWADWVLHDLEFLRCPLKYDQAIGSEDAHHCRVPGPLTLRLDRAGGKFDVSWQVAAEGFVALPGSVDAWPVEVSVDGQPAPVMPGNGAPKLWLSVGLHRVTGSLSWDQRPQSLALPEAVARLEVIVDGVLLPAPERRGNWLWLGGAEVAVSEADALRLEVYRHLHDELPLVLTTRLNLVVSGKAREIVLGPVLPADFVGTAVGGSLAARLEADGRLRVQLAPGTHSITVAARALMASDAVTRGERPGSDWPEQEVWSFGTGSTRGPVDASGGEPVDPATAGVPSGWQHLPAFLILSGQSLTINRPELSLDAMAANRLSLQRRLWLDFDGSGWTAMDGIHGEMFRGWRLDALPVLQLQRADSGGDALLLTASPLSVGAVGVEWRESYVALQTTARLQSGSLLPVSGWDQSLDQVEIGLNLPPGYQLLAVPGADSADSAWVERWRLGDVFLLCLGGLMAWRLGGALLCALAGGFLLLSFDHYDAPMMSVLLLLLLLLLARWAEGHRLAVWLHRLSMLALLVVAWVALPYAAGQLSLALHPQLERYSVASSGGFNQATSRIISGEGYYQGMTSKGVAMSVDQEQMADQTFMEPVAAPMAPAPQVQSSDNAPQRAGGVRLNPDGVGQVLVYPEENNQFAPKKALNRVDPKAVVQAGGAEPQWSWSEHHLSVSGPVAVDQQLRLVISPPWLTRLWRVLVVALIGMVLLAAIRRLAPPTLTTKLPRWALLAMLMGSPAMASEFPSQGMLEELRTRLSEAPDCAPQCAQLADVRVQVDESRLVLTLSVHAGATVSVPLPSADGWHAARVEIDGVARDWLLLENGDPWASFSPGAHQVRLEGALVGDRLRLRFPMLPARIEANSESWLVSGIDRARLPSGQLELNRQVRSAQSEELRRESDLPAYVRVVRSLSIDLDWTVVTTVQRIAPDDGAINVAVPLLAGERLLAEDPPVRDGAAQISLAPGANQISYMSRLEPNSPLQLTAPALQDRLEVWSVAVSPIFHAEYDGAVTLLVSGSGTAAPLFNPLPGDKLSISVSRPEAVAGATLAIDGVGMSTTLGARLRDSNLTLSMRATRGGQHALQLPADAELIALSIDGRQLRVRPEAGRLLLPVTPGVHAVDLSIRETVPIGSVARLPSIDLGLAAANVGLRMDLPDDRWLLFTGGPQVGPAVRYWSILALVVVLAYALGRAPGSPVPTRDWLILGIGLSTVAWQVLIVVAVWLFLLGWRQRRGADLSPWRFCFAQLGLLGMSVVVLLMLLANAWNGLLGDPSMMVEGNGSSATQLIWFADHSDGQLPGAWAFSLPMWVYKGAILAWSLWLASAMIGWLRLAFEALGSGGWWKTLYLPSKAKAVAAAEQAEAEAPVTGNIGDVGKASASE